MKSAPPLPAAASAASLLEVSRISSSEIFGSGGADPPLALNASTWALRRSSQRLGRGGVVAVAINDHGSCLPATASSITARSSYRNVPAATCGPVLPLRRSPGSSAARRPASSTVRAASRISSARPVTMLKRAADHVAGQRGASHPPAADPRANSAHHLLDTVVAGGQHGLSVQQGLDALDHHACGTSWSPPPGR